MAGNGQDDELLLTELVLVLDVKGLEGRLGGGALGSEGGREGGMFLFV